jgi:uncharacterized protein
MRPIHHSLISVLGALSLAFAVLALLWPLLLPRLTFLGQSLAAAERAPAAWRYSGEEVHLTAADGTALHGWFLYAAPEVPSCGTVLFLHGNAGNLSGHAWFTTHLTRYGLDVFLFDYRGYGASEGRSTEAGLHLDAAAAYEHLERDRGIPPGRLLLVGHSLGAAVAARLAAERPAAGLVLATPFSSVPNVIRARLPWFPVSLLPWRSGSFDSFEPVRQRSMPLLVLRASDDEVIPGRDTEALFRAASEPKLLVDVPGGHNEVFDGPEFHEAFPGFLRRTLGCSGD